MDPIQAVYACGSVFTSTVWGAGGVWDWNLSAAREDQLPWHHEDLGKHDAWTRGATLKMCIGIAQTLSTSKLFAL